jgi:hypothetical protein
MYRDWDTPSNSPEYTCIGKLIQDNYILRLIPARTPKY